MRGGSGGYLYFDNDSGCDDLQKSKLETAVWDATTLASYASDFPNSGAGARGRASGIFYMGPDYASQQTRIAGNLKRAWQFKTPETKEYITVSCKDTKNRCAERVDGKSVGGYAWTYSGWVYYYHYITLCPPFFTIDTLDTKIADVEKDLAGGSTKYATDMSWLQNTGQFFLHELMHTRIANGADEPHITDEYVNPIPKGEKPGATDIKAYGPAHVHNLARRNLNQGGGATRASTNADSYAILANAIWWWDTTGYFPGVPDKPNPSTAQDDFDDNNYPVSLYVDFDNSTNPSSSEATDLLAANLEAFGNGPPDADDEDPTTTTTAAPPPPTKTTAPPPPSPDADTCGVSYKVVLDHFDVYGKNFDPTKFANGSGLKKQIQGCGALTGRSFTTLTGETYQWHASGNLPIGTKACVGRAVESAGGASADGCHGAG